jgi:outer membrane cobalamin receptor
MAGLRWDYSSTYGSMTTPRFHMRWTPADKFSAHASAGRGYHNPHRIAEYSYLLASSRRVAIDPERRQEDGWNFGGGITSNLYLLGRRLTLNAEYYFTRFGTQAVVDLDSDPHAAILTYNHGHSRSHTLQAELSYQPFDAFTFSAAYRYTDVKENYGDGLKRRPLTSASKGLFSISYTPMMEIWQFDATLAIIGGGRMPSSYVTADGSASWDGRYKAYPQLSAQVTRNFRHWALYIGGENLTGYKQRSAIIDAANPWGDNFDATMVYAPLHGATVYAGVRYNFTKY